MIGVHEVAAVREAEQYLAAELPPGALMQRAAYGLSVIIAEQLKDHVGRVSGSTVAALIGPGRGVPLRKSPGTPPPFHLADRAV